MHILKPQVAIAVVLVFVMLTSCNEKENLADANRPEQLIVGTTGAWGITQQLNKTVGPDTTQYNLDLNQDGSPDLSFVFDYNLLGFRTAQSFQKLESLHDDVELAGVMRSDTVYLLSGDTILDTASNRYFHLSTTNCTGLGAVWTVISPRIKLRPFDANQSVVATNQDWTQGSYSYINSSYQLPIELNGIYNGLPFTSFREYAAPCSDFPSNATVFVVFRFQKSRLGYVELFVKDPYSVRLVRCVVQK